MIFISGLRVTLDISVFGIDYISGCSGLNVGIEPCDKLMPWQ